MKRGIIPARMMVILLLMLVVIVVLIVFTQQIFTKGDIHTARAQCRQSIDQNANLRLAGYQFSSRILCPTEYHKASGSDEEMLGTVAQELYRCWNDWGAGEEELFKPEDSTFCVVCSVIEFDTRKEKLTGLMGVLNSRVIPRGGQTYQEFLTGVQVKEGVRTDLSNIEANELDVIDTSKPLSIVFSYRKDAKLTKGEGLIWGLSIGAVAGLVTGTVLLVVFPPAGAGIIGATIAATATGVAVTASTTAGAIAGGGIGYYFGHDTSADWDARIIAVPFTQEDLNKRLQCDEFPVFQRLDVA